MPRKGKRGGKSRHNDSDDSDEESTPGMGAKARPGLATKGGGSGGGGDGRGGSGSACCPAVAPGVSIGGGGTAAKAWPLVTVDGHGSGGRLDCFLAKAHGITRARAGRAAKAGLILVNGKAAKASAKVRASATLDAPSCSVRTFFLH